MASHSRGRNQPSIPPAPAAPAACPEPEVRRWPHPVDCTPEPESPSLPAALHYIHCSLSYQNQLLSEIRALLEALSPGGGERQEGK